MTQKFKKGQKTCPQSTYTNLQELQNSHVSRTGDRGVDTTIQD
jgi:hypothetical protein